MNVPSNTNLNYARREPLDLRIEQQLVAQEHARQVVMWLKLLAGVPATFVAPFVLACFIFAMALRSGAWLPFWGLFALCSLVLVPLILGRASRHRTDFLGDVARDFEGSPFSASSYGEFQYRTSMLSWAGYLEIFFWGPYLVLEAYTTWRGGQQALVQNHERAVQIIRELLRAEGGVAPGSLRQANEPPEHFGRVLRYLEIHEWIDFSRRKDRVWLLTDARETLLRTAERP